MDLMDMGIGLDAIRRENEQGPLIPLRHDKHAGRDAAMKARGGAAPAHSSASNAVAGSELYDTLSSADFSQEVRVDAVKTGIANRLARISASAFPADAIVANCGALPIGAILSLFAPAPAPADADADADAANDDAVPTLRRDPASCYHCGAFASASCRVDLTLGAWRCALCDVGNVDALYACGGGGSNGGRDAFPELTNAVVEYHLESGSGDGSAGGGGGGDGEGGGNGGVVFFVVDDALDDDEAALLRASLSRVASGLDASQSVGFVTYAASVAVYELGGASAVASAEVLSGAKSPRAADLDAFLGKEEEDDDDGGGDGGGSIGRFIAPARACRAALEAVISSIKPAGRSAGPVAGRARCAGVAIETAAAMIRRRGGPGRILVCAGGPCTRGPGGVRADDESELFDFERATAAAYVDELSSTIASLDVTVDIISGGREAIGAARLAPLADATGGSVVLVEDFGATFESNAARAAARRPGRGPAVTVRLSHGVQCARVIGPVRTMTREAAAAATRCGSTAFEDASDVVRLKTNDPTQAIAVFFQFSRDLPPDAYAHAQFASWDVTPTGTRVARVVSIRIPTVRTKREYLAAVDNTVAGILAGKKAALDAANESIGRLGAAKRLRARVMHLAEVFSPPSAPPPNRPFPGALREFAEAMYHACRGGMLSEMLGHADERAAARGIFLSAGVDVAAPMLSPRLFKRDGAGGAGGFVSVPASDLALCGDAVLFLDAGDCVFGWVGREVASDAARSRDARETLAAFGKRLTRDRFPIPSLKIVTEGSSQARYVVSRLAPGHVDAEHEQNVWFPPIAALAPEARKKLMASFLPTEEPSFALWMRGLGLRIREAGDDDVTLAMGGGEVGVGFNTQIV